MKRPLPRPRHAKAAPILLIFALLPAFLVFAATAGAAETVTGESTAPSFVEGRPSLETTITKGAASFEPTTGHAVFDVTTAVPPEMNGPGEVLAAFSTSECAPITSFEGLLYPIFTSSPVLLIESRYEETNAKAVTGSFSTPIEIPVSKSISGTTTTLSVTSGNLVGAGYKCAIVRTGGFEGAMVVAFPIKAPPPAPAPAPAPELVPAPAAAPVSASAPPTAPSVISIAKPKPLEARAGAWKTVHVKVTNTGGTTTAQGSLRVKAAKGVIVKPEVQKLPILAAGATFVLSVRVKLTEAAHKKSTLTVTGTAGAVTGNGSIVLKLES